MKHLIILFRFDNGDAPYNPTSEEGVDGYMLPIGLAYISAVLKKAGKDVTVLNLNNWDGLIQDILRRELQAICYDVAFLGGLSMYYPHVQDVIKYIRYYSGKTKVVVGGGIITAQPEIMFNLLQPDYGVIGEGELTCLELVEHLEHGGSVADIPGLIFSDSFGSQTITKPRDPVMDLDALPFPDYESFGYKTYLDNFDITNMNGLFDVVDNPRPYPLLASRSCVYNCTFCFHPLGQKYRQRSIDNIMQEIRIAVEKHRVNIIIFYDEMFSNNSIRVIDFCRKFKAYSDTLPFKLWFQCQNRVDTTTDEMLKVMKASGAYLLSYGLESYSPTVLASMKKHITPEQIDQTARLTRENKLGFQGNFIFGDPAESCETAKVTLDYVRKNRKLLGSSIGLFFVIPFQGTPVYKRCVRERKIPNEVLFIKERELNWFKYLEPMNMTTLSDKEFDRLKDAVFGLHLVSDTYTTIYGTWYDHPGDTFTEVRCPSCKEISLYKNLPQPKGFSALNVGCRHCHYRFHVVSRWYPLKRFIIKVLGFRRVYWLRKVMKG
jgi:anaerobic magnesium-protoporphyrin IX monomethyl ester cyclase